MHESLKNLMNCFGLLPDVSTMTVGDALVYMVLTIFALVSILMFTKLIYSIIARVGGGI